MNDTIAPRIPNPREIFSNLCTQSTDYPMGPSPSIDDIPWITDNRGYSPGIFGLHNELLDFYNYMKPSSDEQFARDVVISRITNVVLKLWPNCEAEVVGSVKTNLYLPTSDIDMVIFGKWTALPLRTLEKALLDSGLSSNITVLDKAAVPIVKMTDKDTGIQVDISFNRINSVRAVDLIRLFIKIYPYLPHLMFVLKQFLLQHNLNEVWTGGLGSYALILMVVRCLQETVPPNWPMEKVNLGALLLRFFELYGRSFNYGKVAIRVIHGGAYVRKDVILQNTVRSSILCIEDPLSPGNDVGRRSYNVMHVKSAFERAYMSLESSILLISNFKDCREPGSILSKIICVSRHTIDCRERIRDFGRQQMSQLPKGSSIPVPPATVMPLFHQHSWSSNPSLYTLSAAAAAATASFPFLISNSVLPVPSALPPFATQLQLLPVATNLVQQPAVATSNSITLPNSTSAAVPHDTQLSANNNGVDTLHPTETDRSNHSDCSSIQSNSSLSTEQPTVSGCQEKSGECSGLAKDFASLSTINGDKSDKQVTSDPNLQSMHTVLTKCDRKRRCPVNDRHKYEGHDDDDDDSNKPLVIQSDFNEMIETKPQELTSAAVHLSPVRSNGRVRKQTNKVSKPTSISTGPVSDSRDAHFPRFVNLSSANDAVQFAQKRRAIGSSRRLK